MSRMVSILPREFDILGGLMMEALDQPADTLARRVSQSRVLSSTGTSIYDGGFFEADREALEFQFRGVTRDQDTAFRRLWADHSEVDVACWYGCFLAVPESYRIEGTTARVRFLVKERLDNG